MSGFIVWDGSDFAAVQMLLTGDRQDGEPACRLPRADMHRMEVRTTGHGWRSVQPGETIVREDNGTISVLF